MKKELVVDIISSLLILLFIYSGSTKLLDHSAFRFQLYKSPTLSGISGALSWIIPLVETIAALLLLLKRTRLTGLFISLILLLGFTLYLIIMLVFHRDLPCSCGGVISSMTWTEHVFFNIFFLALTIIGIKKIFKQKYLRPQTGVTENL
jgi:hypothetical protein